MVSISIGVEIEVGQWTWLAKFYFVCPEFSVIIEITDHFFLKQLEGFVIGTLKALKIVGTTFKRMPHFLTDDNLITTLCSVCI